MTSSVFYPTLNEFCRKYLLDDGTLTAQDAAKFEGVKRKIDAEIFENLALFDQVNFKVYGEGVPVAFLLNLVGLSGLEELLAQDAIRFTLWTPMVVQMVKSIPGVDPIAAGTTSSKVHTDPEESIEVGLRASTMKLDRGKRRALARKLRDVYALPKKDISHDAVRMTKSAYQSGRLDRYGFQHRERAFQELTDDEKGRMTKCADDLLEYSYLLANGLASFSKSEFYDFFTVSQERLARADERVKNFSKITNLEAFPDLQQLHSQIDRPFERLIKIRARRASHKFRDWLDQKSTPDTQFEITKEYVDALADAGGFFETRRGKLTKSVAMASVGAGVGAVLGGLHGSVAGAGIIHAAHWAIDVVDEYLADGLTKGWTPRLFVDDLRKLQSAGRE